MVLLNKILEIHFLMENQRTQELIEKPLILGTMWN